MEEIKITDYGLNGFGIGHIDDKTYFVRNGIVGEIVAVEPYLKQGNLVFCNIQEIKKASNFRVVPPCKYYQICGGCNLQHLEYLEQLNYKKIQVTNSLKKFLKFDIKINDCIGSTDYHYRNKISLAVREENGTNVLGYFQENTHKILEIDECLLDDNFSTILLKLIRQFLTQNKISCYNETTKKGNLKYIVARKVDKNILICCVVGNPDIKPFLPFYEILKNEFGSCGLSLSINNNPKTILGEKFINIAGINEIKSQKMGVDFVIDSASFMQVNDEIANNVYIQILDNISVDDIVINNYSGAGLLTSIIAKKSSVCIGIEINKFATKLADNLTSRNEISNQYNLCGKCEEILPKLLNKVNENILNLTEFKSEEKDIQLSSKNNLICVLDPPRKGCEKIVLESIIASPIKKIIYLSCNPATLGRDLQILTKDFEIQSIQPFDMFPQTSHIENLVVMTKKIK